MFGVSDLKEWIFISDDEVECPVRGCKSRVSRQRRNNSRKDPKFRCPEHKIYISPTTFEYESYQANLLWNDEEDRALLEEIFKVKRESRMASDNSEDAVTWNVFRYLELRGQISPFIQGVVGKPTDIDEVIYWSYSQSQNGLWKKLKRARREFEMVPSKGSEPDLILVGKGSLVFIEAKLNSSNRTKPGTIEVANRYMSGGQKWWDRVFAPGSDFNKIAIEERMYELARFWLLGTWMAERLKLRFYLINLVSENKDQNIVAKFSPHIVHDDNRQFLRITWEQIYHFIHNSEEHNTLGIENYLLNKTVGYNPKGYLQKAFQLP